MLNWEKNVGCGGASDFILIRLNEFRHETQADIGLCDCQLHDLTLCGISLPSGIWVTFSICSEIHHLPVIHCFIMKNLVSIGDRSYYSFWQTGLHTPRKDKSYSLFFSTYVMLSEAVCVYSHPRPTPLFPGMLFSRIWFGWPLINDDDRKGNFHMQILHVRGCSLVPCNCSRSP